MKLLYLFVDWIVKENEPDRQVYGIVLGIGDHQQYVYLDHENWYELLKEVSKQRLVKDRNSVSITPHTYRMRYFIKQ